jgi:exosome complex component RRP40
LSTTAFNGATKRHKPEVKIGNHVVAWVSRVDLDLDVELSCEDTGTQRDWSSGDCLFGVLTIENSESALVVDVSCSYAAQLQTKDTHPVFRSFGRHTKAEVAVGRNGRVFVKAATRAEVLALSKTIVLGERLSPVQTEALFRGLLNL